MLGFRNKVFNALTIEVNVLGISVFAALIANIGFFVGVPISGAPFWISLVFWGAMALFCSKERFVLWIAVVGVTFLFTALTVTYAGCDALTCYLPMERLLYNGWNPVAQATEESVRTLTGGYVIYYKQEAHYGLESSTV